LAASLAARSDHPVSLAIANAAVDKKLPLQVVDNFEALAGRGVRGEINGEVYHLGNHRLVEELGLCSPALEEKLFALEKQGKSVVLLLDKSGPLAASLAARSDHPVSLAIANAAVDKKLPLQVVDN
ncbi:hypothetical protein ACQZEU_12530, partial [Corynebacterium diphtheriae]